jgi:Fe2+ transport system protein B
MNAVNIILLALIGCNIQKTGIVNKIQITKVDFAITSIISVDCNELEYYFKEEIENIVIEDGKEIEKIMKIISSLERDTTNYKPDIRAQLLLYYDDNRIDTLCMSNLGIILNNQSFKIKSNLVDLVERLN